MSARARRCDSGGIASLPAAQTFTARKCARQIFSMVTEERGTTKQLRELVNHEALLELIFYCVDMTKKGRAIAAGSAKRQQHPIDALILQIIRDRPDISTKLIELELDKQAGGDVIYNATHSEFEPRDDRFKPVTRAGLPDRCTRARKKILRS
jgi:hypothetical protein